MNTILIDFLRKYNNKDAVTVRLDVLEIEKGVDSTTEKMRGAELQKSISEAVNDLPPVRKQVFEMSREQADRSRQRPSSFACFLYGFIKTRFQLWILLRSLQSKLQQIFLKGVSGRSKSFKIAEYCRPGWQWKCSAYLFH